MKKVLKSLVVAATVLSGAAQADVIDFTNSTQWGGANNLQTFTSGNTTLSAFGTFPVTGANTPAVLTFNAGSCGASVSPALACQGTGIGIDRTNRFAVPDNNDEIDRRDRLQIDFATALDITNIEFLKVGVEAVGLINEIMSVRVNNTGPWQNFTLSALAAGGYFASGFNANGVTRLDIRGGEGALGANSIIHDGSLARITYVPTPATSLLLGAGLFAAIVMRQRKPASNSPTV